MNHNMTKPTDDKLSKIKMKKKYQNTSYGRAVDFSSHLCTCTFFMYIIDFSDCVISQFSLTQKKLNGCIKNYMMSYHGDRDQM